MVQNSLSSIVQSYHEKHLSHAFLIETNDQDKCFKDLKQLICEINCEQNYQENCMKCNLCHLISTEQLPSFFVLRPNGQNIRKEQILELKKKFSTKPLYSKYNVYVILNAEKFSPSAANTILKFLEEPEEGILGFFVTNNKENIIDTIKSRCQIVPSFYSVSLEKSPEFISVAVDYLCNVHEQNNLSLEINLEFIRNHEFIKEDYQKLFQVFLNIYYYLYKAKLGIKELPDYYQQLSFLLKKELSFFLHQMNLVEELEGELGYNVSVNLLLDRFILETRSF